MPDPWMQDACSLVDAFRAGELSPVEALDASLAAIDASTLNAFSFLDADTARATASRADVSLPFGGVPIGIKELDHVAGWPFTYGSLAFQDQRSDVDATQVGRLRAAGVVPVGLTTASEFGFVGYTSTRLNGTTLNPWARDRTPGGSSGGSAAAVGGGLVPLCPYMLFSSAQGALPWSIAVTGTALGVFGWIRGRLTGVWPVRSALQTILIGGLAAAAAFLIARAIS